MNDFTLNAELRSDLGKGASRRLRRLASLVPAVVYGGDKAPESISMLAKEVAKLLENEASYSHIIELNVGGTKQNVIIKALQRHPAKGHVLHADFVRVVAGQKLTAIVPVHFIGEEAPIKKGGEVSHVTSELEVSCLPKDLPEFIEVDVSALEIGSIVHLSDVKAPKGVEFVALAHGNDLAIANVHAPRVVKDEDEEAAEGAAE
ncbi:MULTISPECIES: 50S ribosomal protein L25/general stress protein Ctc [Pseudomonas syringae group]|uniref:Large ribosomal subunit protein bL25 n=4 Tax=Pseudomonas syringae group TaxID=136849 RepID=RL25_PSESM|nr:MULTISPECIES: 50S ribosomal protein L25/general stress protein Ctc [Pseudomonas syringae group]Q888C7.1 RecName: Full=Large ribosomal subunit protein bL25; AltName: Full=50S ribosomal protein L25; AltName: Full=General stress protein CTC [Pseudomonas syringae pv. tomato str. DC3000]KPC07051.1 50S ribosomal protein L25 [Pseudomonas amygdali pv. lachrymans]AAO54632.1 ribosomal 5S rRNA E-loop binding protein Ctc/L25/TL5 [Pseudomonas syringae pv. tomato str. DC3000]EGH98184.1 50S ribosomal prote